MSSCELRGANEALKRQILEYPTHAVSSEGGGTVLRPWISIWLLIILSLEAITCRARKVTYKSINTHNHQCNGIQRPFFLKTAAD